MCSTISLALLLDAPRKTLLPLTDERDWESGLENDNENELYVLKIVSIIIHSLISSLQEVKWVSFKLFSRLQFRRFLTVGVPS